MSFQDVWAIVKQNVIEIGLVFFEWLNHTQTDKQTNKHHFIFIIVGIAKARLQIVSIINYFTSLSMQPGS